MNMKYAEAAKLLQDTSKACQDAYGDTGIYRFAGALQSHLGFLLSAKPDQLEMYQDIIKKGLTDSLQEALVEVMSKQNE